MADYIYLLDHRLSAAQRNALRLVREVARAKNLTVFLVGGAVRDLTSGSPVRDLDVVVLGNALKLKKDLEKVGAAIDGELESGQSLYARFPGQVRVEVGSTLSVTYPKPGKPVYKPATILEDLRRRDFTANAMALSLNDGSFGLLMDPLNGVADIENRQLRLVSNYGFIEDPVRMIRAARLMARLGWTMDEKTQGRYETGKQEGYIAAMSDFHRGYETEEIFHEQDPLRVLKGLEAEGWVKHLAPFWTSAKVNTAELDRLNDTQAQLQMQDIHADPAVVTFPLLTAKLSAKETAGLKASFPRQGFVAEVDSLDARAREVASDLAGKGAALPSQAWRILTAAAPETVLHVAFTTKSPVLQAKFKSFYTEWPQARQKMPYTVMQEMRIVPELPGYEDLLEKLFFELMDGKLTTPEEIKAFLEPFSPPAPPPPVNLRRFRAAKKDAKPTKSRAKKAAKIEDEAEVEVDLDAAETDPPRHAGVPEIQSEDAESEEAASDEAGESKPKPVKRVKQATQPVAKPASVKAVPVPPAAVKAVSVQAAPIKTAPVKAALDKVTAKPAVKAPVRASKTPSVPAKKSPPAKVSVKNAAVKSPTKKAAPAPGKPAAKKTVAKGPVKSAAKTIAAKAPAKTAVKAPVKIAKKAPAKVPSKKIAPVKATPRMPAKKVPAKKVPARRR